MTIRLASPFLDRAALAGDLAAAGLAGLVLTAPESVWYATGYPALPGVGNPILFALRNQLPPLAFVGADGHTTLIAWIGAALGFGFDVDETRTAFDRASALDELAEAIAARMPAGVTLAVESDCPLYVAERLRALPAALVSDDELLLRRRLVKSAGEIALLREATRIAESAAAATGSLLAPGVSRLAIIRAAKERLIAAGADGIGHATIAFGAANPEIATDEMLRPGQVVTLDIGASLGGYQADIRRLYHTGPIPADLSAHHAALTAIVAAVGAALQPGITFGALYDLAVAQFAAHDLPPYFLTAGHSIGLQTEEAWIAPESDRVVQPGMVLNIELYSPFADGTNIGDEETYLVTASGPERLTTTDPAIRRVG